MPHALQETFERSGPCGQDQFGTGQSGAVVGKAQTLGVFDQEAVPVEFIGFITFLVIENLTMLDIDQVFEGKADQRGAGREVLISFVVGELEAVGCTLMHKTIKGSNRFGT